MVQRRDQEKETGMESEMESIPDSKEKEKGRVQRVLSGKERGRMRRYTVTEYEQEDYDYFKRNLTSKKAIEFLERISRGYLPDYNFTGTEDDFDNYCLHKAIDKAIEALEERSDIHDGAGSNIKN